MSTANETTRHSAPVPIAGGGHSRARSGSGSSDSSAGTPPPPTPRSLNMSFPRVGGAGAAGPGTSPIMSYILGGQSPTSTVKSPSAFTLARNPFCGTAVEDDDKEPPMVKHARRASVSAALPPRFPTGQSPPGTISGAQTERGSGLLRRLSLGGTFRPQVSPPSANGPKPKTPPPIIEVSEARPEPRTLPRAGSPRAGKRRATLGVAPPPLRAPSPMGERILKGHFDGFN